MNPVIYAVGIMISRDCWNASSVSMPIVIHIVTQGWQIGCWGPRNHGIVPVVRS